MKKIAAAALLAVLAVGTMARGDDRQAAREAFNEGTRLYDIADFQRALDAFKRAYLHFEEPSLLYNIAQCYRQLGDKPEAIRFYRTFIRKAPPSPQVEDSRRLVAMLETQLAEKRAHEPVPPPPIVVETPVASPAPMPVVVTQVTSPDSLVVETVPAKKPVYKKAWFWAVTVLAAGVVATAIGVGVFETRPRETSFQVHAP